MKHFNTAVSVELQERLESFSAEALDNFISDFKESNGCSQVEELFGVAQSGWIPMQMGGFTISEFYHNDIDSSYHFSKKQTEFNEKYYTAQIADYAKEHGLDEIDYDDTDFQDWEVELFDEALLRLVAYVDNFGLVQLELSVNYTDAPYFRLKADKILKKMAFTEQEFMTVDFDEIFEQLKNYK